MERLVNALGGQWPTVAAHARPLKTAIEQHKPWLNSREVAKGIQRILDDAPTTGEFPKALRGQIEAIFRKASPWDAVKEAGENAIPAGEATRHYRELIGSCRAIGLWIVPVGEMEGFCKTEGGHGPQWVQRVLTRDLAADPELQAARRFVGELWQGSPLG